MAFEEIITNVVESPFKSLLTSVTGLVLGYVPKIQTTILNTQMTEFDKGFQHVAWFLTSAVAVTAIITFIQKQVDRYKNKKKNI